MEKLFKLKENGTAVKTEVVAGVTTYIGFGSETTENKHVAVNVKTSNVDNLSEDEYADYTMLDNDDIYSLLANN